MDSIRLLVKETFKTFRVSSPLSVNKPVVEKVTALPENMALEVLLEGSPSAAIFTFPVVTSTVKVAVPDTPLDGGWLGIMEDVVGPEPPQPTAPKARK